MQHSLILSLQVPFMRQAPANRTAPTEGGPDPSTAVKMAHLRLMRRMVSLRALLWGHTPAASACTHAAFHYMLSPSLPLLHGLSAGHTAC